MFIPYLHSDPFLSNKDITITLEVDSEFDDLLGDGEDFIPMVYQPTEMAKKQSRGIQKTTLDKRVWTWLINETEDVEDEEDINVKADEGKRRQRKGWGIMRASFKSFENFFAAQEVGMQ